MSLISDTVRVPLILTIHYLMVYSPVFFVHSFRLDYLREVEDPYGIRPLPSSRQPLYFVRLVG